MASRTQYIFVFLGEFGFELLNWQGVIRKFAATISSDDRIVCCSRANLWPLYEMAHTYIDISDVGLFKQSQASEYSACLVEERRSGFSEVLTPAESLRGLVYQRRVEMELKSYVIRALRREDSFDDDGDSVFVFSSRSARLNDCSFGPGYRRRLPQIAAAGLLRRLEGFHPAMTQPAALLRRTVWKGVPSLDHRRCGSIYGALDVTNNVFKKIKADTSCSDAVDSKLGWASTEPFILCQGRQRDVANFSKDELPRRKLASFLRLLSRTTGMKAVLLTFKTGRRNDSYSDLPADQDSLVYYCSSFPEQAYLIDRARYCLFFTEGDLGSHIYVPPLMGKDVMVVAPGSVYRLESSPIEFWNRSVFRFGGQIIPRVAEEVLESERSMRGIATEIVSRAYDGAEPSEVIGPPERE